MAVWFLIIDLARGKPLMTPSILGEVILLRNASPSLDVVDTRAVIGYTALHLAAWRHPALKAAFQSSPLGT